MGEIGGTGGMGRIAGTAGGRGRRAGITKEKTKGK